MLTLDEFWVVEHLDVFLCVWNFSQLQIFFFLNRGREASRGKFMLTVSVSIHLPNKLFKILLR